MIKLLIIKKNREKLLNRAKEYYENNKERLREQSKINIKNYLMKKKNIKREYGKIDIKICQKKIKKD